MRKQILLADNDPDFLNTRAESIDGDYQVFKAYTLEDARQLLASAHFHLAILDVRMVNDDDERDVSGLTLAKDLSYRAVPKIILTGHPSVQAVRSALGPVVEGLPPAVDFVAKADGPEAMLEAIDKAFEQFVQVNWNLSMIWDSRYPLSFPYLISLLQPDVPNDILVYRANELEDLFRRLFYSYQQIRFSRLHWHDHWRFCLSVLTQSLDGVTDIRILVCGDRKLLELEREQKEKLAPDVSQSTELRSQAATTHFGANLYGLPGADIEMIQTLMDFWQISKERSLKTVFTHLLIDVLKKWHLHGQIVREKEDLMSIYRDKAGLSDDDVFKNQLDQRLDALIQSIHTLGVLEIKREQQRIVLHFHRQTSQSYPNPLSIVYSPFHQYNAPIICRISPGTLRAENILVDSGQKTWLTDFANAGQAPQWWDFVCLEVAIRFEVSQAPDLLAWQEFEECLIQPGRLDEHLDQDTMIPELRNNVVLIEQIRRQAASETGSDVIPYYAGLLACMIVFIANYDSSLLSTQSDRLRGAHLLLAASMLAERIGQGERSDSYPASAQLKLDDNDKLWVGDRYIITFSGLRLKLLRYLYQQAGQIVSIGAIVEKVYAEKYDPNDRDQQNQRIRQEINRLRDAIEPKPSQPCYIMTIREKGYCLQINGKPEA